MRWLRCILIPIFPLAAKCVSSQVLHMCWQINVDEFLRTFCDPALFRDPGIAFPVTDCQTTLNAVCSALSGVEESDRCKGWKAGKCPETKVDNSSCTCS